MSTKTDYIKLIKPEGGERYNITIFNDNNDKIDDKLQRALKGVELGEEDDLDDYNGEGRYYLGDGVDADTVYNKPVSCNRFNLTVLSTSDDVLMQIFATESNNIYVRSYCEISSGKYVWQDWQLIPYMSDLNDAIGEIEQEITDLELGTASKCDKATTIIAISASDTKVPTAKAVVNYINNLNINADKVVTGVDDDGGDVSLSEELDDIRAAMSTVNLADSQNLSNIFDKGCYYGYNASDAPNSSEHYVLEVLGGPQIPDTNLIVQKYYSTSGVWYRTSGGGNGSAYTNWVKIGG